MTVFLPHLFNAYVWSYDYGRISAPSFSLTLIGDQRIMTVFLPISLTLMCDHMIMTVYLPLFLLLTPICNQTIMTVFLPLLFNAYGWSEEYDRISAPSL